MKGHYEPQKDFRVKSMSNPAHKSYWTNQYRIYKEAIVKQKPMTSVLPSHPYVIKFILRPSKEEQMSAVLSEPKVIQYISNPDPYVQLRVVKVKPDYIKYVKYPTDEMWIWAIDDDPYMIFKNRKPTWAMVRIALEKGIKGLNSHEGLTSEMISYLALVA